MATPAEIAVTSFSQNFNCSQAVFSAFAPQFGLERETALKLASPFGGGVARRGEVCGGSERCIAGARSGARRR